MPADRQLIGLKNRAAGRATENQLDEYHHWLDIHNYAFTRHNGTQSEMRGGKWFPVPSPVDYDAFLIEHDAHYVAFDLKHITSPTYSHPKDKLHQTDYLYRVDEKGGTAFLLIVVELPDVDPEGFAFFPQPHWQVYYDKGFTLHMEHGVSVPGWSTVLSGGYIPDWLEIAIPRMLSRK